MSVSLPAMGPSVLHRPLLGILFMCLAASLFPVMNGLAKLMSESYSSEQVVWARTVSHLIFVLALFMPRAGLSMLKTRRPGVQFTRSCMLIGSTFLFFSAIKFVPIAQAASISFTAPLIVVILAGPMLGERITLSRVLAVVIAFIGVLVVIRPGAAVFQWASILIVGSAFCFAVYQVLTRRVAAVEALGAITVLAVDKTGTITQNRMAVAELAVDGAGFRAEGATKLPEAFHGLAEFAMLATPADPFDHRHIQPVHVAEMAEHRSQAHAGTGGNRLGTRNALVFIHQGDNGVDDAIPARHRAQAPTINLRSFRHASGPHMHSLSDCHCRRSDATSRRLTIAVARPPARPAVTKLRPIEREAQRAKLRRASNRATIITASAIIGG
jgi:uncharacterized membrane protein